MKIEFIKSKLEKAEKSGFTKDTKSQILNQSKRIIMQRSNYSIRKMI
jgi:antitoxin ParD1/3/4